MGSSRPREHSPIAIGQVIGGKYLVERLLGEGGMGSVWGVRHVELKQRFALKVLPPEAARSNEARARFSREARAAAMIKSEHVARVFDVGTLEDGFTPMIVMEHLEGSDLQTVLDAEGPLPIARAVDLLLQACEAIAEAHSLGIVHRDIKPSNLFLTQRADRSPCVKVLDFGISKIVQTDQPGTLETALAKTKDAVGSPYYVSPEQARAAEDIDGRTDVWSLGVTLFQLLTGTWPFKGKGALQVCAAILEAKAPKIRGLRCDIPEGLETAIDRCFEKDRDARWQDVGALTEALAPFGSRDAEVSTKRATAIVASTKQRAKTAVPEDAPLVEAETQVFVPLKKAPERAVEPSGRTSRAWAGTLTVGAASIEHARRARWMIALAAGLIVGGAIVLGLILALKREPESPRPAASVAVNPKTSAPPIATPPDSSAAVSAIAAPNRSSAPMVVPNRGSSKGARVRAPATVQINPTAKEAPVAPPKEPTPSPRAPDPFEDQR